MKFKFSSRTNRRGFTFVEVLVAFSGTLLVLAGTTSLISTAGTLFSRTRLQSGTDQEGALALGSVLADTREAKEVQLVSGSQFRIYYPEVNAEGRYDRFTVDRSRYVEYARTDASGTPNATGRYLWRKTNTEVGRSLSAHLDQLTVTSDSPRSLAITLGMRDTDGTNDGVTNLNQRVLYLRNN